MIFGESFQEPTGFSVRKMPEGFGEISDGVSGMWRGFLAGNANGSFSMSTEHPFVGSVSQKLTYESGSGVVGIENKGLNRQGMVVLAGKKYEGSLRVRASHVQKINISLQNTDGSVTIATAEKLTSDTNKEWQRLDFSLTPDRNEKQARFAIMLSSPGEVEIGYAYLQPGSWGRYKDLPVRKDVVKGLQKIGISNLRYGGSMINAEEYRWKKMIGPRALRPPYKGLWYRYSTNGWGIFDFLNVCEAAGIPGIPAINSFESPQDMADFMEYVNGPRSSKWGSMRAEDGHPAPYNLRYVEIGNEERVDDAYYRRFEAIAKAMWAVDSEITLIVGDFSYDKPLDNPDHISGTASGITDLSAQRNILKLAKANNRAVWFDIHIWNDEPNNIPQLPIAQTFSSALEKMSTGADFRVIVFELNANNNLHRRGIANALAINSLERGEQPFPIICSANCLQVDDQNDNGWDQGLLFLNSTSVWAQSPGYVMQMIHENSMSVCVKSELMDPTGDLDVTVKSDSKGKILVLQVVNKGVTPHTVLLSLEDFKPVKHQLRATELAGSMNARNTASLPEEIIPVKKVMPFTLKNGDMNFTFKPSSFTVLRFE